MKQILITIIAMAALTACNDQPDVVCWASVDNDMVCTEFNYSEYNLRTDLTDEEFYQYVKVRQSIEESGMSKAVMAQLMADLMTVTQ